MPRQNIANTAAIATGHPLGAAAGIEMLREGGNAVDAAVAAMIALSVVVPGSVGLGGYGGSAVIRLARPKGNRLSAIGSQKDASGGPQLTADSRQPLVAAVDFDSCAPLGFRDGLVTADAEASQYGARSVTVPAVVAGLDLILREHGSKSWREVSQPAIRLAEEGFEFDSEHKRYLDRCAPKFDPQSLASLFPDGALPKIGDRWRQPDLARILRRLSEDGPGTFYEGEIAQSIVRFLHDRGGILTDEDFRKYRPQIVEPICVTLSGRPGKGQLQFHTPPPPSGGVTSLAIVQTLERLDLLNLEPWGAQYFHLLGEAMKLCWQERKLYLGDPEFVDVPIDRLSSEAAADARAEQIRTGAITRDSQATNQSPHTANVIAIDGEGNMISLTATQGMMYGAHLVVDGMGLVLNHGMSRFDYSPGHPNAPAAGKRMQHNMAPMIALKNGQPAFAFGMPGGPKIVSITAQLAIDAIAFGATPAECVATPRLHTDGDEPLRVSQHMSVSVVAELEKLGHVVRREEDMGGPINVLAIDPQSGKIDIASGEGMGAIAGI
jgi:gamma-glutamyltranspeptidase/glutathione hydrolase